MTIQQLKEYVKGKGWVIVRKGRIYFKRRDTNSVYNQGITYACRTKDPEEAFEAIKAWLLDGFPKTKAELTAEKEADPLFLDFLDSFWHEDSLYFKAADYEGRHITKSYIKQNRMFIRVYGPFFKGIRISELNEKLLNSFFDSLFSVKSKKTGRGLARGTIARIKASFLQPLKWGRQKGLIPQIIDFAIICPNVGRRPIRNRGILTQEETLKLLSHKWSDRRAYLAFCIAVNCGLRVGEIRALKIGHINREGFLLITNSFNDVDGLKCTKTGKNRVVPCPDSLMSLIVDYIYSLPEEERADDRFLLTDDGGERPLGKGFCIKKFYTAMRECGIKRERANPLTGEMEYICFHSLRHQTATRWVESGLDVRLIAKAMGHTVDMLSHYSDHFNLHDMDSLRAGLVSHNSLGACTA